MSLFSLKKFTQHNKLFRVWVYSAKSYAFDKGFKPLHSTPSVILSDITFGRGSKLYAREIYSEQSPDELFCMRRVVLARLGSARRVKIAYARFTPSKIRTHQSYS